MAQNFSNKGKDFWLGYGFHCQMVASNGTVINTGGTQEMVLYFTSDKNANITVEIPGNGYSKTYSVIANQVTESTPIPKTGSQDARISDIGTFNTGIHIISDVDIVAYAHIYNGSISGATLLFPTNTLGKDYYSINYNQITNQIYSNSFTFVVAVEDNTEVEITPSDINKNGKPANTAFTVTLNKGQVYNLMGTTNGKIGTDLTGTRIRTISNNGVCKKIAVFSGAGKISIGGTSNSNNQAGSADNLFAQSLPASAWGIKYLTAPTGSQPNNYFRICVTEPNTIVKINGSVISTSFLQRGFFYELKNSTPISTPGNGISVANTTNGVWNLIEADKPITVAQYCTTQGMDGNPANPGDPEMIYLSPVEQTINNITLNSTTHSAITQHGINVIIGNGGISSFKLDGVSKVSSFKPHPNEPKFSYAIFNVSAGSHTLYSDTGFNSIAYGFGAAESYGYNAGTNIKDLYSPVFQNLYARLNFAATCAATPFQFSVPLSYQPSSLKWDFGNNQNISPNLTIDISNPIVDSSTIINGKTFYYYSPSNHLGSKIFTYTNSGVDTIKLYASNPTPDGCGSTNAEYDIPVVINNIPQANYAVNNARCISDDIQFTDASTNLGLSNVVNGFWTFDAGLTYIGKNPSIKFPTAKIYNIHYQPITDFGCIGDTTIALEISSNPIAKFGYSDSCIGKIVTFSDSSNIVSGNIIKWYWNYGDGTKIDTVTSNTARTKTYNTVGTFMVSLTVESNTGCKSVAFAQPIIIRPLPITNFKLPNAVCLPIGTANFLDSTMVEGGGMVVKWKWDFGDLGIDSIKNPIHNYTSTSNYFVKLTATSNYGCVKDTTKQLSNIFSQPKAKFGITNFVCLHDSTFMVDSSNGIGSVVSKWNWNFGDGTIDSIQNPKYLFNASGIYTVKLFVITNKGCVSDTVIKTTTVNPLPHAGFDTLALNNYCENRPIKFIDTAVNQSITSSTLTRWYWNMGNHNIYNLTTGGFNTFFNEYYNFFNTYTIKMMVENSLGCKSDTVSKVITIHALPLVGFTLPEVCLADALANFTDTTTIPDGSTESLFLWNYNASSSAITPPPSIASSTTKNGYTHYNSAGNYIVSFKTVTSFGCDSTLSKPFTVNGSVPHANFVVLNDSKLCSNDSIRIKDGSTVDFGTIIKNDIFWNYINSSSTIDSIDNNPVYQKLYAHMYPNFQLPTSKTYQIKLITHSGNSFVCMDSITKIITIHQSPKVYLETIPGICNDATSRVLIQGSEVGSMPGLFAYYGNGISGIDVYTPKNIIPGIYPIKYVYTTSFSCADSTTKNITVWQSPIAKWGVQIEHLCEKNTIQFTDSSIANYSNIIERIWDFGDATNAIYSNTIFFNKKYSLGNNYLASLKVITDSGCQSTFNVQNLKINYLPTVSFEVPSICLPDGNGTFLSTSTIKDTSENLFTYLWNFGDPNNETPSTLKSATHKYSALGPVNVQLKVTSKNQCVDSLTQIFNNIYPQAKASFIMQPNTICLGDNIQFNDKSDGISSSIKKWNWDLGNGITSTLQNPNKQFLDSGTFNISLYIYNQQNCSSDTAIKQIIVYPYPKLNMGLDLVMLQGGIITIKPTYFFGNDLHFKWSPATYLSSDTVYNPMATPLDDIRYYLQLSALGGCTVKDSIFITVLKSPIIPNIFSPNGDGINDTWKIKYLDSYPGATVDVFNRYGQQVFHSNGYAKEWDGTLNGKILPIGTYYYMVNPKNNKPIISGSVTIIR